MRFMKHLLPQLDHAIAEAGPGRSPREHRDDLRALRAGSAIVIARFGIVIGRFGHREARRSDGPLRFYGLIPTSVKSV
jgi:hypothetical protein